MVLWRLSGKEHAGAFDGGYGLLFNGRWNTVGHPVTYCATSPSLCVLEKLVHVEDPALLPELVMVKYRVPDELESEVVELTDLPADWRADEGWTQQRGDSWQSVERTPMLRVPSAVVPLLGSPDLNVVLNHQHAATRGIVIERQEPYVFDPRLL